MINHPSQTTEQFWCAKGSR